MWPWGHLAVGYLLYSVYTRYRYLARPRGLAVAALAIGTQFPDLVDKPLAYWWVLPEGRSLGHSFLVAVPVCLGVVLLARRRGRAKSGAAFAIGYLSHLPADALDALLGGNLGGPTFLLWPLLPAPDYETSAFVDHWEDLFSATARLARDWGFLDLGEPFVAQAWLFAAVVALWLAHRGPPLPALGEGLGRWLAWLRSR